MTSAMATNSRSAASVAVPKRCDDVVVDVDRFAQSGLSRNKPLLTSALATLAQANTSAKMPETGDEQSSCDIGSFGASGRSVGRRLLLTGSGDALAQESLLGRGTQEKRVTTSSRRR